MKSLLFTFSILGLALGFTTGCGLSRTSPRDMAKAGSVYGGLAGAGSGALIGAAIPAGDIAASALLGTAVGIPAGAVVAYYAVSSENERELSRLDGIIERNKDELQQERLELIEMRRQVHDESALIRPDRSRRDSDLYIGATLGRTRP
ncbi:MAG: hypothetical protein ACO3XO_06415 [Bdellovibrionota bacterium]|jgi:hypothetical protein